MLQVGTTTDLSDTIFAWNDVFPTWDTAREPSGKTKTSFNAHIPGVVHRHKYSTRVFDAL